MSPTMMGTTRGLATFILLSTTVSLSLVTVWLFVAVYVARIYNKAIAEKKVVC